MHELRCLPANSESEYLAGVDSLFFQGLDVGVPVVFHGHDTDGLPVQGFVLLVSYGVVCPLDRDEPVKNTHRPDGCRVRDT